MPLAKYCHSSCPIDCSRPELICIINLNWDSLSTWLEANQVHSGQSLDWWSFCLFWGTVFSHLLTNCREAREETRILTGTRATRGRVTDTSHETKNNNQTWLDRLGTQINNVLSGFVCHIICNYFQEKMTTIYV